MGINNLHHYTVIEVLETEYRGKSDGPVDMPWAMDTDELGVMTSVAMILEHAREGNTDKFPSLKTTTHAIRIELIPEEANEAQQ